jgi:hypothetical protein
VVSAYAQIAGTLVLAGASSLAALASAPALAVSRISASNNPVVTSSQAAPVDIVIAVDESESINSSELKLEETAARLIALGEFAPESRIGVLGFGGDQPAAAGERGVSHDGSQYICPAGFAERLYQRPSHPYSDEREPHGFHPRD